MLAINRHPGLVSLSAPVRALLCAALAVALAACGAGGGGGGGGGGNGPTIHLSTTTLTFSGQVGVAPAAQQVTITNSGTGTLATPTATVSYGSGSAWLSASVTGASAPYTLTVTPSVGGLVQGAYTATISNASTGASNTPQAVAVTLTITGYGSYGGGPGQPPARQVDPANPSNSVLDTDCDGISDYDEINVTHTDPANPDTDGDGIPDGVELGRTQIIEPARCTGFFVADADPTTTTNPLNPDTDGDGVPDGIEDWNHNGRVDPGESDPNAANPVTTAACSTANLAPVVFDRSQPADVQLATRGFSEKQLVSVSAAEKGWLYWNATSSIAAFALKKATVEADVATMETAGRTAFAAIGTVSNPLTQTFTTWDGYPAIKATYNWSALGDAKTLSNSIATAFLGGSPTNLWPGTAGVTAPSWVLQVEYVRRSNLTADIVGAFMPASLYTGDAVIPVDDVVNGSAFAQSDDTGNVQCESFQSQGYSKLDILWVVDNSGSMADHQAAVKNAGAAIVQVLSNTTLDWRMGLVTTAYYDGTNAVRDLKDFTIDLATIQSWFDQAPRRTPSTPYAVGDRVSNTTSTGAQPPLNNYVCITAGTSGTGSGPSGTGANITDGTVHWAYDPAWVGTAGTGTEKALLSVKNAIQNHFLPATASQPGKLRPDAKLLLIFLSDTDDQDTATVASYEAFFDSYDGAGSKALADGILCQDLVNGCGDNLSPLTHRVIDVVNYEGGILASINDFDTNTNTVATLDSMILSAAGATSPYRLAKSPISSSFKVAMAGPTVGTCGGSTTMVPDVPRSRADGFDYYAPTNSILFYGACRPTQANTDVAVSYRYWVPGSCPADGCPSGCNPACPATQYCDATNTCVCYADCGGCATGYYCDTTACACVVIPG